MGYYTWDNIDMCIATINQLTAWRNADAKLATGECIAADKFLNGIVTLPHYMTQRRGTGNYVRTRDTIGRRQGLYTAVHRLQTAQFLYWLMQTCATTENTPVGYNTHAITLLASTTPLNFGIHMQHKLTSNDLLWDLLGLCPTSLNITCSETRNIATQQLTIPFAFKVASDDFTKTDRPLRTTGTIQKEWGHAVAGGLGPSQTAFTYNNVAVECDIIGININIDRDVQLLTSDDNHYKTIGIMYNAEYTVTLDVIPDGDDIWTIMDLEKDSYAANDLDLDFKFEADATNDYIRFNYADMYLQPIDKEYAYNKATDSYSITLEPMSDASTLTVTSVDGLDNDHYENP